MAGCHESPRRRPVAPVRDSGRVPGNAPHRTKEDEGVVTAMSPISSPSLKEPTSAACHKVPSIGPPIPPPYARLRRADLTPSQPGAPTLLVGAGDSRATTVQRDRSTVSAHRGNRVRSTLTRHPYVVACTNVRRPCHTMHYSRVNMLQFPGSFGARSGPSRAPSRPPSRASEILPGRRRRAAEGWVSSCKQAVSGPYM